MVENSMSLQASLPTTGEDNCVHMMTPSNGNIYRVAGPVCGEFTGHRSPVTRSFDAFFDQRLEYTVE